MINALLRIVIAYFAMHRKLWAFLLEERGNFWNTSHRMSADALYSRFGVYFLPQPGPLADFGARWLGWDVVKARAVEHFPITGLPDITKRPRKYGFHATLKPPFRLASGVSRLDLETAVADLAGTLPSAQSGGLDVAELGQFLALRPTGDVSQINALAAACVTQLDHLRAPLNPAELARRRKARLTPAQEMHLDRWGYPFVLDQFRFHMTLTGRLEKDVFGRNRKALENVLPALPASFLIDQIALVGERQDGHFELCQRYALTGQT